MCVYREVAREHQEKASLGAFCSGGLNMFISFSNSSESLPAIFNFTAYDRASALLNFAGVLMVIMLWYFL